MNLTYYKERLNIFLAYAPPTRINNTYNAMFKLLSKKKDILEVACLELGMYSLFPFESLYNHAIDIYCNLNSEYCEKLFKWFFCGDGECTDNMDRAGDLMA